MPTPCTSFLPFSLPFLPPVHLSDILRLSSTCLLISAMLCEAVYPVQETGFTDGEIQELLSLFQAGRVESTLNSGSQGSNRSFCSVDDDDDREKKRRRMLSNRASARRSRWRKKQHLENLNSELNRLKNENRELKYRLSPVLYQCSVIQRENEQLRSESVALSARLSDLYRILVSMEVVSHNY